MDVIAYVAVHTARLAGARAVHLHPTQLSSEVVKTVRTAGLEVHSGFANDVDTLQMMDQLGIHKFDTDNLRLALEYREGLASSQHGTVV